MSTSWKRSASVTTPRIARRVVCGLSETIATLRPTIALTSVDLPTLGRPASATKPDRVGGGVSSVGDVDVLLRAGADKVAINTGAIRRPEVISEITRRFGSQVLVLSVDARRADWAPSGFEVTTHGGRAAAGLDAVEWASRGVDQGVGEILLNSMDADGTTSGFDLEMIRAVRAVVDVPLIASGGAGQVADFPPAIAAGADAVLAATVFHFGTLRIAEVKSAIEVAGFPVRRAALAPTAGH